MNSNRYSLSAVLLFAVTLAACQADPTRALLRAREGQSHQPAQDPSPGRGGVFFLIQPLWRASQLGPTAAGGTPGPDAAGIIPGNLASGNLDGFVYAIAANPTAMRSPWCPRCGGSGRAQFLFGSELGDPPEHSERTRRLRIVGNALSNLHAECMHANMGQ